MSEKKKKKSNAGRPTKYRDEYAERVYGMCLLGATNEDIARNLEVATSTVEKWIKENEEFSGSVKRGRLIADEKVAQSLYNTALKGNTTAQIFWLKNRSRENWREKHEVDHSSADGTMTPTVIEIVAEKGED